MCFLRLASRIVRGCAAFCFRFRWELTDFARLLARVRLMSSCNRRAMRIAVISAIAKPNQAGTPSEIPVPARARRCRGRVRRAERLLSEMLARTDSMPGSAPNTCCKCFSRLAAIAPIAQHEPVA